MRFLLGDDGETAGPARRYIYWRLLRAELRWHPRLVTRQRVTGTRRVPAGGVVLNFLHHGQYDGLFASLRAANSRPVTTVVDPQHLAADADAWKRQHLRLVSMGGPTISADDGFAALVKRVGAGEIVAIASDVPGRTPVKFLDRDVLGSYGAARLAMETGAPVVIATSHPATDSSAYIRLHPPLRAADFRSGPELLAAMLAIHEPAVRAWPEAYDRPTTRWSAST